MTKFIFPLLTATALAINPTPIEEDIIKPNQVEYKDTILTYNTDKVDDVFFDDGIELKINDENIVRQIEITNEDILTYNDISVGDKIAKIQSSYEKEYEFNDSITVVMADDKEIAPTEQDKTEDAIFLMYYFEDDILTRICIYDAKYALTFK